MTDDTQPKRLICTRPFEWLEISSFQDNAAWLCCSGHVKLSTGSASYGPPEDLWYGSAAQEMRQSVVDGSFRLCHEERCEFLKDKKGPVQWVDPYTHLYYKQVAFDRITPPGPKTLNAAYDDSCNLRCPSCRTEIRQHTAAERDQYDEIFHRLIHQYGDSIETLVLTGSGDAFASRHCRDVLMSDVWNEYPNLDLVLMTNGLQLTPKMWEKIEHIHHKIDTIQISIDAASEETYHVNRPPGDWNKLWDNLLFLSKVHERVPFKFNFAFVVQQNNWKEMERFAEYGLLMGADSVVFTPIMNWGTFTNQQYIERAVHLPEHNQYNELYKLLSTSEVLHHPMVSISSAFTHYQNLIAVQA